MSRSYLISLSVLLAAGALAAVSDRSTGWLLVANKGSQDMGIIDPSIGKQVAAVPENGVTGHEVIASPDGKTGYVPIYGDSGDGKPGNNGSNMVGIEIAYA